MHDSVRPSWAKQSLELQMLSPVTIYHEITISMWCDQISQELIWECQNHSHPQAQLMSTIPRNSGRASLRYKIGKGLCLVNVIPQMTQFFWSVLVVVTVLNCHHFSEKKVLPAVVVLCTLIYVGIAAKFYNEDHF